MLPRRFWHEMTTRDFADSDTAKWIAVLPVAAIEQHGPHLPVYTDTCIAEGMIARTIELLPADLPVTFLPVQAVGKSNEHISSPGTLRAEPNIGLNMYCTLSYTIETTSDRLVGDLFTIRFGSGGYEQGVSRNDLDRGPDFQVGQFYWH